MVQKTTMSFDDTNEVITQIRDGDKLGIKVFLRNRGDPNSRNNLGWTLLHIACLEGQAEIAEILLDAGATINCCTTDMCTPLHKACASGNEAAVKVLLDKGAYINAQDKMGNTPLHDAAKGLHTSVVKLLLERKADKTRENKKSQIFTDVVGQQLMPIVESGDIDILIAWLDWGLSANTFGNLNWSLLHHASAMGQINIASVLLERGADVNAIDSNRSSPLHGACFHGHKRIVELLIGRSADVNVQDQRGNTPLHSAITGCHPDIINMLLESGCNTSIPNKEGQIFTHLVNEFLKDAVEKNRIAQVISLLKGRADPNTTDSAGTPVLCCSAFKGELLLVDALLDAGADPNLCSKDSLKSPLHYAACAGHFFVLKSLLDKNASVHLLDRNGSTALHEAAREGALEVITVLVGRGASLNIQDVDGNTPLHAAARWGQSAAVEMLIEKGAADDIKNKSGLLYSDLALMRAVRTEDASQVLSGLAWGGNPDVQDEKGWTLLHHAAYKGALEVCGVLVESGAKVDLVDKHGRTALLLASYRGNQEIMEILLNNGSNLNAQDYNGQTPLHWAADEGSIGAVELLLQRGASRSLKNKNGCLYSDLLLKHLYFAVRHNDSLKVECLLKAGADQTAVLRGTGTTPRDEAKRRKLYPILKKMVAMAPKKKIPPPSKEASVAIEDVSKLFENQEDRQTSSSEESSPEEDKEEEEWDPDEDAYWKMHNAPMVLKAKDVFQDEDQSFWEHWDDKPKAIPAKEFFKDDLPWWVTKSSSSESESSDDEPDKDKIPTFDELKQNWGEVVSAKEFFRDDECWWRDAVEDIGDVKKPKTISAKEFFKDETSWWETESEDEENHEVWVPAKDFFKNDKPWWEGEDHTEEIDDAASLEENTVSDMEAMKNEDASIDDDLESITDDWDTANESMVSDTSTMFSTSEGEKVSAAEVFSEQPWWDVDNEDVSDNIDVFEQESLAEEFSENISDNSEITKVAKKHPSLRRFRTSSLTESESSATLLDSYGSNDALNDEIFDLNDLKLSDKDLVSTDKEEITENTNLFTIDESNIENQMLEPDEISALDNLNIQNQSLESDKLVTSDDLNTRDKRLEPDELAALAGPNIQNQRLESSETIDAFDDSNALDKRLEPDELAALDDSNIQNLRLEHDKIKPSPVQRICLDTISDQKLIKDSLICDVNFKETEKDTLVLQTLYASDPCAEITENSDTATRPIENSGTKTTMINMESLDDDESVNKSFLEFTDTVRRLSMQDDELFSPISSSIFVNRSPRFSEVSKSQIGIIDDNTEFNFKAGTPLELKEGGGVENIPITEELRNITQLNQLDGVITDKVKLSGTPSTLLSNKLNSPPINDTPAPGKVTISEINIPPTITTGPSLVNLDNPISINNTLANTNSNLKQDKLNMSIGYHSLDNIGNNKQQKYLKYRDEKHVQISKPIINKMDACLAKVDATLAWLDARMANDNQNAPDTLIHKSSIIAAQPIQEHDVIDVQMKNKIEPSIVGNICKVNVRIPEEENTSIVDKCSGVEKAKLYNSQLGQQLPGGIGCSITPQKLFVDVPFRNKNLDPKSSLLKDSLNWTKVSSDPMSNEEVTLMIQPIKQPINNVTSGSKVFDDNCDGHASKKPQISLCVDTTKAPTIFSNLETRLQNKSNDAELSKINRTSTYLEDDFKLADENIDKNTKLRENNSNDCDAEGETCLNPSTPINVKLQLALQYGGKTFFTASDSGGLDENQGVVVPPRRRTKPDGYSKSSQKEVTSSTAKHIRAACDSSTNNSDSNPPNSIMTPPTAPRRKRDFHHQSPAAKSDKINLLYDSDSAETNEFAEDGCQSLRYHLTELRDLPPAGVRSKATTNEASKLSSVDLKKPMPNSSSCVIC